MRRYVSGSALGLFIIVGGFTLAAPASAHLWRNYASDLPGQTPFYMIRPNDNCAPGGALKLAVFGPLTYYFFDTPADSSHPGDVKFRPFCPPNMPTAIGVSNNIMANGTPIIDWTPLSALNQDWIPIPEFFDLQGAMCLAYINAASPSGRQFALGVSGGVMASNQPIVIWDFKGDQINHPDQFWCAYDLDAQGNPIPNANP